MLFSIARATRRQIVKDSCGGAGSRARKMELGKWVTTMACISPRRLARLADHMLPIVEMNLQETVISVHKKGPATLRTM